MPEDPFASVADLPGVFESVEAARGSVDRLLRRLREPAVRARVTDVTAETVRVAAWASAALEGRDGSVEAFRPPVADRLGANALRLYVAVPELVPIWESAPAQALARLHVLAAGGGTDEAGLGRPTDAGGAARLEQLAATLGTPTLAPAVVVASVVHGEVLATQAFGAGSGLVARAAARCVLVARGLDPRSATVPEAGHLELGTASYRAALDGYRSGTVDGVAGWVSHCAQAVALGASEGRRLCDAVLGAG